MHTTIFDTSFAKQYGLLKFAKATSSWLVTDLIPDVSHEQYVKTIQGITPVVKSPLSDIFMLARHTHAFEKFGYISYLKHPNLKIPEILTLQDLSIYGKDVSKNSDYSGVWINLMPVLAKGNSRYNALSINSISRVVALMVRGMLCMSYEDNGLWLSPKSAMFLIEFYAQMMNVIFDRMFKLTTEESGFIKLVFAYRYAMLVNPKLDSNKAPLLVVKSKHLFREIQQGFDELLHKLVSEVGTATDMDTYVRFIIDNGPDRMGKLSSKTIYGAVSISATSSVASWISADYPPYLMYLILGAMSSIRNPIISTVIDRYFTVKYIRTSIDNAIKNQNFYAGMK